MLAAYQQQVVEANKKQLADLKANMGKHRDDALRRYSQEMAVVRDEQLAAIAKINFDDLDLGSDGEDEALLAEIATAEKRAEEDADARARERAHASYRRSPDRPRDASRAA